MTSRTVLGFDYGTRRIGIAVGQDITCTAQGLQTISNKHGQIDWNNIDTLVAQWNPQLLVVGMPSHADGRPHELKDTIKRFGDQLKQRYNLPVYWVDEQLSSVEAENLITDSSLGRRQKRNKAEIDKRAAEVILQSWLNNNPKQ